MTSKKQEELCSECDANAKWYCVQDGANFCDQHNTVAHSLKSQKSHKIVSIGEKDVIIKNEAAKPMNCKNHHMPLCLYCLSCKDVCCVACVTVDIHKQHSDQVKLVVDAANGEKEILNEHLQQIEKLKTEFTNEQNQLQQALKNIDISKAKCSQDIDKEFDRIITFFEARRKVLKEQLQEKSKTYHDNICLRLEDLNNINSSLNKCLEERRCVLMLNDFAALSQSKQIIEKLKNLETENVEYHHQTQLTDSIPFYISTQRILELIGTLGIIGRPPVPSFVQHKCKASYTYFDIEWEPIEYIPPITAYVLELGQSNNNFSEVYRGLETKHHLKDLKPNTSYVLRLCACNENEVGNAAILEMKTLQLDLNNWILSMSSTYAYPQWNGENTRESLLDGQFITGAATGNGNVWIQATFPYPVPVTSVTIAPLHKNSTVWAPTSGNGGRLQYSHDNQNWTTVGTIAYGQMQQQKIEVRNVTAQYWRLSCGSHLGTSSFIFK